MDVRFLGRDIIYTEGVMMNNVFYTAFESQREAYLCHHGVKGMRWGQRKEYVPVGDRENHDRQYEYPDYDEGMAYQSAQRVASADDRQVKKSHKLVKGLVIGGGIAAAIGGIVGGSIYADKKNPGSVTRFAEKIPKVGNSIARFARSVGFKEPETDAGVEALKRKMNGGG